MSRHLESGAYSQASDWLMGTARRNPEALLLLAAGCVLLMRSGERSSSRTPSNDRFIDHGARQADYRDPSSRQQSGLREGVVRAAATAADYASDVKERVADAAGSYAEAVSEFAADAGRTVSERSARVGRQTQSTLQAGMNWVLRDQPLAVAVLGIAAGSVVAAAFPSTEVEKRTLGGAHDALADAAAKAGETVKEAAGKVGEHLKNAAEERGLTRQGLKDLAGEVTQTFTSAVTGRSDDPRGTSVTGASPQSDWDRAAQSRGDRIGSDPGDQFARANDDPGRRGAQ